MSGGSAAATPRRRGDEGQHAVVGVDAVNGGGAGHALSVGNRAFLALVAGAQAAWILLLLYLVLRSAA